MHRTSQSRNSHIIILKAHDGVLAEISSNIVLPLKCLGYPDDDGLDPVHLQVTLTKIIFNMPINFFYLSINSSSLIVQCVPLAGSPGKCWFTKRTKVQYICMSYL
jgi:hypothetical protein